MVLVNTTVPMTPSIDDPGVVETVMFLRRGTDDQRRKVTLLYNDLRKYIVSTPTFNQLFQDTIGTVGKIQKARAAVRGGSALYREMTSSALSLLRR